MFQRSKFLTLRHPKQSWRNKTKERKNPYVGRDRLFTGGLPRWPQKVVHEKKTVEGKVPSDEYGGKVAHHTKNSTDSGPKKKKKKLTSVLFGRGQTKVSTLSLAQREIVFISMSLNWQCLALVYFFKLSWHRLFVHRGACDWQISSFRVSLSVRHLIHLFHYNTQIFF